MCAGAGAARLRRVSLLGLEAGRPRGLRALLLGGWCSVLTTPWLRTTSHPVVRMGRRLLGGAEAAATLISARRGNPAHACDG